MVSPNQRMSPLVQGAISIFILVHLYIIVTWGLPGSRFRTAVIQPVQDYVINTGEERGEGGHGSRIFRRAGPGWKAVQYRRVFSGSSWLQAGRRE